MKYLVLAILCLLLIERTVGSTFPKDLFETNSDPIKKLSSLLNVDAKPILTAAAELSKKALKDEHKDKNQHSLGQKQEKPKKLKQQKDQQKTLKKYIALVQILEKALKHKYLLDNLSKTRVSVTQGTYLFEYYHSLLPSDKVILSSDHLITAQRGANKMYLKRHDEGSGVSLYETLQDKASGKWVKANKDGNSLVADEIDATWFQVFGMGSMFIIQYFNPYDIINCYQFGANNGPVGTQLRISSSQTEFFKLIPA